jgi:UDPglucose 6-dehydrogenase
MQRRNLVIIGAGVVGQATGKGLKKKGHNVTFLDTSPNLVKGLRQEGYSAYLPEDLLNDPNTTIDAEISMFCVDTPAAPSSGNFQTTMDLSHLVSAIKFHSLWLSTRVWNSASRSNYHLLVIRSTVLPGTTKGIILPLIEKSSNLKVGEDFGLCMQPEFLRTASAETDFLNSRVVVIGQYDNHSGDILEEVYSDFDSEKIRVDLDTAEFMKYVCNSFNAVKISFSNEMWLLGKKVGVDANSAIQLALKSAEGYWNPMYGSVGGKPYGGTCLPKDVECFLSFATEKSAVSPLLSASVKINKLMEEISTSDRLPKVTIHKPKTTTEDS